MNVTPVQNNNQSFGMAFKLKGNGAKKLAEEFYSTHKPDFFKDNFVKRVADPIKKLQTLVTYDGDKVIVENTKLGKTLEVLDDNINAMRPFAQDSLYRTMKFHVKENGVKDISLYEVRYPVAQNTAGGVSNELALVQGVDCKLRCAREIARDMDLKAEQAVKHYEEEQMKNILIEQTTKELTDLFG